MNAVEETKTKEIFRRLAEEVVLHPDMLRITERVNARSIEIRGRPSAGDFGKLLGKGGAIWRALAHLAQTIGEKTDGYRVIVNDLDEAIEGVRGELYPPYQVRQDWDRERIGRLLNDTVQAIYGREGFVEITDVGDGKTTIKIHCSEREARGKIELIQNSLMIVFMAVGKRQGRSFAFVTVDDVRN